MSKILYLQITWWLDLGSSLIGALVGAMVGGYLTYIIGSRHLTKQLEEDRKNRKTDFIIRQLEYQRDRIIKIRSNILNIYNKISHEVEYRKMIEDNEHLAYDEKTNIVLFKDIENLIVEYEQLDSTNKHKNTKSEIRQIRSAIETILENSFYSKMKMINTYELKLIALQGKVKKVEDSLEGKGLEIIDAGLEEVDNFIGILDEDINYVQGRLLHEENNL